MKFALFITLIVVVCTRSDVGVAHRFTNTAMLETMCGMCSLHCTEGRHPITTVKEIVSNEVNSGLEECRVELKQTENKLLNLLGKCPVRYNGTCFWGIFRYGKTAITYKQASDLCENEGGRLAGVYSNDHLNQLIMYALPQAAADSLQDSALWILTGMTYKNGQLFQRDGSLAPNLKWRPGYPTGTGERVNVDVRVDRENGGLVQYPDASRDGVFCEIDI